MGGSGPPHPALSRSSGASASKTDEELGAENNQCAIVCADEVIDGSSNAVSPPLVIQAVVVTQEIAVSRNETREMLEVTPHAVVAMIAVDVRPIERVSVRRGELERERRLTLDDYAVVAREARLYRVVDSVHGRLIAARPVPSPPAGCVLPGID